MELETVIAKIQDHYQKTNPGQTAGGRLHYIIAGSYPASLRARPSGLQLPFNDVDVYFGEWASGDSPGRPEYFDNSYFKLPGIDVDVNAIHLTGLSLEGLIRSFDINCIAVGVCVESDADGNVKTTWHVDEAFKRFCADPQHKLALRTDELLDMKPSCIVRLLRKHEQLGLDFTHPTDDQLKSAHHRFINDITLAKIEKLSPTSRKILDEMFTIKRDFFWESKRIYIHQFATRCRNDSPETDWTFPIVSTLAGMNVLAFVLARVMSEHSKANCHIRQTLNVAQWASSLGLGLRATIVLYRWWRVHFRARLQATRTTEWDISVLEDRRPLPSLRTLLRNSLGAFFGWRNQAQLKYSA